MFRIETVKPYPEDYTETTKLALEEKRQNARPELAAASDNMDVYDAVYLGYPNWYGTMPMAVCGPVGVRVAQIGFEDSRVGGVAKAIEWLWAHFAQSVRIEELAELAHMSPSSFHQHFKSVTSMSPLQYQKVLRLQEARHLMLTTMMDATVARRHVGNLRYSS